MYNRDYSIAKQFTQRMKFEKKIAQMSKMKTIT